MPEAVNVNSQYYLKVRRTRPLLLDIYLFHFYFLVISFWLFYQALFLACQNLVKELSASGFGKKKLCLQKKSVCELRELEGNLVQPCYQLFFFPSKMCFVRRRGGQNMLKTS